MESENVITQAELAAFAPDLDLSAFSTTTISGMISSASAQMRRICNVDGFLQKTVTSERDRVTIASNEDIVLSFRRLPVQQGNVTGLRLVTNDFNQSLELQNDGRDIYFIQTGGLLMTYPTYRILATGQGIAGYRDVNNMYYEVDYVGGYATAIENLPYDLKRACMLFIRDDLEATTNPNNVTEFRQGSYSEKRAGLSNDGNGPYAKQALAILERGNFIRRVP